MATRTKRTYVLIAIFVSLTMLSVFNVNQIYNYDTDDIIDLRAYVFKPKIQILRDELMSTSLGQLFDSLSPYVRGIYVIYVADIELGQGTHLGLLWMDTPYEGKVYESEMPWIVTEIKPTKIARGRTLDFNAREGVVGKDFNVVFSSDDQSIEISMDSGKFYFVTKSAEISIDIVGRSSMSFEDFTVPSQIGSAAIFTTSKAIEKLRDDVIKADNTYVARVVITVAGGSALNPFSIDDIEKNKEYVENVIKNVDSSEFDIKRPTKSGRDYKSSVLIAGVSLLLIMLIGAIYAYFMVVFRRFDIATLRAIGWSSKHIRMLAIGEFSLSMILGFIIGVIIEGTTLISYRMPITKLSFLAPLFIVIISILIGLVIISKRVLKIPPMEAFRAR